MIVYGGDFEMEALASGAVRALNGEEELKEYTEVFRYGADSISNLRQYRLAVSLELLP